MMDLPEGISALSSPVLYACVALGVSLAAVTLGFMYTKQKQSGGNVNKSKSSESEQTDAKHQSQTKTALKAAQDESVVTSGAWPMEDKPQILPMPENIPENMKKILDMGFPGCPIFRRMEKPKGETQEPSEKEIPKKEATPPEDKPEILPMPENIPEEIKKVLDMGFPGCPVFRRMAKPDDSEGDRASDGVCSTPVRAAPVGAGGREKAAGEAADTLGDSPEVLLIPNEMPDDLKTILEMGIPGARFKKASELTEEDKKALSVDEKSILYAQAMKEKVGVEGMKDLAALSQVLKSPAAVATLGVSGLCPQGVHCAHHCSCLFKVSRSGEVAEESSEAEDERPQIMPIPDDAPENIKKILEMGFPGCPLFRRAPAKSGGEKKDSASSKKSKADTKSVKKGSTTTKQPGPSSTKTVAGPSKKKVAKEGEGDSAKKSERDPVEYCSHLQSEVKRTKQKVAIDKIEEKMTAEQKEQERQIQSDQLAAIFNLMQSQQEKFGVDSMEEIQSQMKLYM